MSETAPAPLTVVPAASGDMDAVRTLFRAYQQGLGVSLCFQGFDDELAALPGAYAPPRGALLLLKSGAAIAGCVAMRPLPGGPADAAEMKRLYLRAAYRGRGGGRMLAEAAIAAAAAGGYARLYLDTLADMTAARRLYGSLGFVDVPAYYANPLPGVRYCALDLRPRPARAG